MVTSRIGSSGSSNTAYGLDSILRLYKDEYLTVRWAQTFDDGITKDKLFDFFDAASFLVLWQRRVRMGFNYEFSFVKSGKDFLPGMGYTTRRDFTEYAWRIHYDTYSGEDSPLIKYSLFQILGSLLKFLYRGLIEFLLIMNPGKKYNLALQVLLYG